MTLPSNPDLADAIEQQPSWLDRIFRDRDGNIVLIQPPNLTVLVAVAATIVQAVLPGGNLQTAIDLIAFGAWFTWAWQELFDGVNYFRRAIGLISLIGLIAIRLNLS